MLVMTIGITDKMADNADFSRHVTSSLERFDLRDWGDVAVESRKMNDEAFISKMGIHASYGIGNDHIWIIKDAFDGPTTILYPSEY